MASKRKRMSGGVKPSDADKPARQPGAGAGPTGSAGPAQRETADPNFTAAHPDRDDVAQDAGVTRMDTGKGLERFPR